MKFSNYSKFSFLCFVFMSFVAVRGLSQPLSGLNSLGADYRVYLYDFESKNEFSIGAEAPVPAASLIKLFVMLEAYRAFDDGRLAKNGFYTLTRDDQVGGAGDLRFAKPGLRVSWQDLVRLMIQRSDNTAANILIKKLGQEVINTTAKTSGYLSTSLARLMMDTAALSSGRENLTSARDVGKFFVDLAKGRCLGREADHEMLEILFGQSLTKKLGARLPSSARVAHKTGEFNLPGLGRIESDAGLILGPGGQIVLVVIGLGEKASSARIGDLGFLAWSHFKLATPREVQLSYRLR